MIHKFHCDFCDRDKMHESYSTTGYGIMEGSKKACFDCCAILDKQQMDRIVADKRARVKGGKKLLYLTTTGDQPTVTNWPGTLRFKCYSVSKSRTLNMQRVDVWFTDHRGRAWHGRSQGDTQVVHCRPVKG